MLLPRPMALVTPKRLKSRAFTNQAKKLKTRRKWVGIKKMNESVVEVPVNWRLVQVALLTEHLEAHAHNECNDLG
jgi:hypothetical protein